MRLIDADALIEILRNKRLELVKHPTFVRSDMEEGIDRGISCAFLAINDAPTVRPDGPRVMTLEEARNVEVVWAEDRSTREIYPCIVKNNMNDSKLYKYGVQWRCWTSRPTDEQRKAVKWDAAD